MHTKTDLATQLLATLQNRREAITCATCRQPGPETRGEGLPEAVGPQGGIGVLIGELSLRGMLQVELVQELLQDAAAEACGADERGLCGFLQTLAELVRSACGYLVRGGTMAGDGHTPPASSTPTSRLSFGAAAIDEHADMLRHLAAAADLALRSGRSDLGYLFRQVLREEMRSS